MAICLAGGCFAVAVTVALAGAGVAGAGGPVAGASPVPQNPASLREAEHLAAARRAALARSSAAVTAQHRTLTALRTTAEILTERYDQAVLAERQAAGAYDVAAARLAAARRTQRDDTRRLGAQAAADLEADAGHRQLELILGDAGEGPGGPDEYFGAIGLQEVLADNRVDLVAATQADSAVTAVFARQASAALARRRAALAAVAGFRTAVQAAVGVQLLAVTSVEARRDSAQARLDRAEQVVAHLEAVRAADGPVDGAVGAPSVPPGPAATAAQGMTAADWALAQLGKPYQWGGAGPATFDCSGLAMGAWVAAGIRLLHWTGDQWVSGPHVPLDALRVGDLVFYAANTADPATIHHVGIYIGRGMMIDAPYTGADVRIDGIHAYAGLIGATRPADSSHRRLELGPGWSSASALRPVG
jgi:cell wall-associated NlpC family hydrolase